MEITAWKLERIRKTKSGASNKVIATFTLANTTGEKLDGVRTRMIFYEPMGRKLKASRWQRARTLAANQSRPVAIPQTFVPIFGSYEIELAYRRGGKEYSFKFLGASPFASPDVAVGRLLASQSRALVLGHTYLYDARSRRCKLKVRLKNFGKIEATGVTVHVKFFGKTARTIGRASKRIRHRKGDPREGRLAGGEEMIWQFIAYRVPKFKSYDISLTQDKVSLEEALSSGAFKRTADVEVAHVRFSRAGAEKKDLTVTARVRNGRAQSVRDIRVTFVFQGRKKKKDDPDPLGTRGARAPLVELKRHEAAVSGPLEPGQVGAFSFTIEKMPAFMTYQMEVAYNEDEAPAPALSPTAAQQGQVVLSDLAAMLKPDGAFVVTGKLTNRGSGTVRAVEITFSLVRKEDGADKPVGQVQTTVAGPLAAGASAPFALRLAEAPKFDSYVYEVSVKK